MKKLLLFIVCSLQINSIFSEQKTAMVAEWRYGFAIDAQGNPMYFSFKMNIELEEQPVASFYKSQNEIKKAKEQLISDYKIIIFEKDISIDGALKENLGRMKGSKRIKHKIENNTSYVSADGETWEKLKIKYYKETGEKSRWGDPLILVYFECSFFKGEYELTWRL